MSDSVERSTPKASQFSLTSEDAPGDIVFKTFRDRKSALWQSVVEEVAAKSADADAAGKKEFRAVAPRYRRSAVRSLKVVIAATEVAEDNSPHPPSSGEPHIDKSQGPLMKGFIDDIKECSEMAFQLATAKAFGNQAQYQILHDKLFHKFGSCDPLWGECITKYVEYFKLKREDIHYRAGLDNVLAYDLPTQAKIAIIGDWGTGMPEAVDLLSQIAAKKPDVVIHLGDIYYTGLPSEVNDWFLEIYRDVVGDTPLYSLAGNHDMYSGGEGYYWLVDQLGQKASYFCVRNEYWQLLAMDTGYNDFDPRKVSSVVTSLTDTEAAWINSKIRQGMTQGLRTCLLSHHQPFSAFEKIGDNFVNDKLLAQVGGVLNDVDVWLWGHEHRLDIYEAYKGVKRGRCLGCSAVPVFTQDDYFEPKCEDIPLLKDPTKGGKPITLGDNGVTYNLAYAMVSLNKQQGRIEYFQSSEESGPLFSESID
jgi:3',5'-cyclic AMP phosphodiesterase CpdA